MTKWDEICGVFLGHKVIILTQHRESTLTSTATRFGCKKYIQPLIRATESLQPAQEICNLITLRSINLQPTFDTWSSRHQNPDLSTLGVSAQQIVTSRLGWS